MATPNLDRLIMNFRNQVADLRLAAGGAELTAASQDGQRYSCVQATTAITDAINEYFSALYGSPYLASLSTWQRGQAMCDVFPEYSVTEYVLTNILKQHNDMSVYGDLPADFGFLASAKVARTSGGFQNVMQATRTEINIVMEGTNTQVLAQPRGYVAGGKFYVFIGDSSRKPGGAILIDYFAQQTPAVQGTTDVKCPPRLDAEIVKIAVINAKKFLI